MQLAANKEFLDYPNHFHVLEMATFAFAPSYTYVPTAPRYKSTGTRRKPAPKQVSIFDKLQYVKPNNAALITSRPAAAAAAAAGSNRCDRPGIRGMLSERDVFGL